MDSWQRLVLARPFADSSIHWPMQAEETAEPQEYARPRRGLLATLTATFSDLSSDDEASSSGRRSGSTTGSSARPLPCVAAASNRGSKTAQKEAVNALHA